MLVAKLKNDYLEIEKRLKDKVGPLEAKEVSANKKELDLYVNLGENTITPEKLHSNGFGDWLQLSKEEIPANFQKNATNMYGYEAYVQGWLSYFEMHCSTFPDDNRTVYFDWGKANKNFELVIYLKPLHYGLYEYGGGIHPMKKDSKPHGGSSNSKSQKSPLPPAPDSTVDPHQPKPPPPPPSN